MARVRCFRNCESRGIQAGLAKDEMQKESGASKNNEARRPLGPLVPVVDFLSNKVGRSSPSINGSPPPRNSGSTLARPSPVSSLQVPHLPLQFPNSCQVVLIERREERGALGKVFGSAQPNPGHVQSVWTITGDLCST
jgi:hypothetical protein